MQPSAPYNPQATAEQLQRLQADVAQMDVQEKEMVISIEKWTVATQRVLTELVSRVSDRQQATVKHILGHWGIDPGLVRFSLDEDAFY